VPERGETASEGKFHFVMEEVWMEVTVYVFRSMRQDENGSPEIAPDARGLGVRPGVGYNTERTYQSTKMGMSIRELAVSPWHPVIQGTSPMCVVPESWEGAEKTQSGVWMWRA